MLLSCRTKDIHLLNFSANQEAIDTWKHGAAAIAEQNLSRLLMEDHVPDEGDIFKFLDRSKHKVRTICRKHKHGNATINDFIRGRCSWQYFARSKILFLLESDWKERGLRKHN